MGTYSVNTLYSAVFNNYRLGSDTSRTVTWSHIRTMVDAIKFTVSAFISEDDEFFPYTGLPYDIGL